MKFHVVTIFPRIFDSYLGESLFKRAVEKKIVSVRAYDLRAFTKDKHRKVDNRPFGGGPGMVLQVQPVYDAVRTIRATLARPRGKTRVILFSARGKKLDAKTAKRLARYDNLILLCGRYEGVDERVEEHVADEAISIGDYVLSGGELPALVLMESVSRFLPGFLGKEESLEDIKGSYPTYTRPEVFVPAQEKKSKVKQLKRKQRKQEKQWKVPSVLLSGDHKKIAEWRKKNGAPDR